MKRLSSIKRWSAVVVLPLLLLTQSCEKTIDVDLEGVDPRLVIEAALKAGEHNFVVQISRTADYFDSDPTSAISTAEVTLITPNGTIPIAAVGNGKYEALVNAENGSTYQLQVAIDGTVYTATSYLPEAVELSEIEIEYEEGNPRFDEGYIVYYRFQDPADEANYYRFLHILDGVEQKEADDLSVLDDRIMNGTYARRPLFSERFESGDDLVLVLRHFDDASYDYFNSLSDIVGSGGGFIGGVAAPGNPNSNWSNDALGYFSAFSDDSLGITIP